MRDSEGSINGWMEICSASQKALWETHEQKYGASLRAVDYSTCIKKNLKSRSRNLEMLAFPLNIWRLSRIFKKSSGFVHIRGIFNETVVCPHIFAVTKLQTDQQLSTL